jgi:hypothetical protein
MTSAEDLTRRQALTRASTFALGALVTNALALVPDPAPASAPADPVLTDATLQAEPSPSDVAEELTFSLA